MDADVMEPSAPPKRKRSPKKKPPILVETPAHRPRKPMGDEHKAALAEGRESGRAVRRYLEALETHRPKRGRKRTQDSIEKRLTQIEETIGYVDSLTRLHLTQERMNLQAELAGFEVEEDLTEVEVDFIAHAKGYSDRKGLSYAAWRQLGVSRQVLREAGIER